MLEPWQCWARRGHGHVDSIGTARAWRATSRRSRVARVVWCRQRLRKRRGAPPLGARARRATARGSPSFLARARARMAPRDSSTARGAQWPGAVVIREPLGALSGMSGLAGAVPGAGRAEGRLRRAAVSVPGSPSAGSARNVEGAGSRRGARPATATARAWFRVEHGPGRRGESWHGSARAWRGSGNLDGRQRLTLGAHVLDG
jgi:hypothetical protein